MSLDYSKFRKIIIDKLLDKAVEDAIQNIEVCNRRLKADKAIKAKLPPDRYPV